MLWSFGTLIKTKSDVIDSGIYKTFVLTFIDMKEGKLKLSYWSRRRHTFLKLRKILAIQKLQTTLTGLLICFSGFFEGVAKAVYRPSLIRSARNTCNLSDDLRTLSKASRVLATS